jgi:uncharacterized membrane protein YgaE (UPF0421/DUF939 family)
MIADLLDQLSFDVKSDVYEGNVEERIYNLSQLFRTMELPKSREEFEIRAALHMLLHELERYISIAKRLKKRKVMSSELQP